jgi:RNA polymerase sigma-70 factor (ECF subfamily)
MEMVLNPGLGIAIRTAAQNLDQTSSPEVSPEVALVRRAQTGDQAAFKLLIEKYQSKVFSIIHGVLRNRNDAEDIAQQVFTKVWFALKGFDFRSSLVTWIYKITVNECYDYLRKQRVRKLTYESDLSEDEARRTTDFEDVRHSGSLAADSQAEQRQNVMRLMERLSEEERTLLMMKEVDGYSVEELAAMNHMNENTVKVKLFRARQKLMKAARKNPSLRPDFAGAE